MTTIERIRQFIESQGISERQFFIKTGLPMGSFNKIKSVGSENLQKIFFTYPDLNMDWVITGRGQMIYKEQDNAAEWKEKYYQLLDMKITVVVPEAEDSKKNADVVTIGHTDELTQAAEGETEYKTKKQK